MLGAGMWFGCRIPVAVISQAYPGNAEICPGFPPPQAALRIILSNEDDAVYIDRFFFQLILLIAIATNQISVSIGLKVGIISIQNMTLSRTAS